MTQREKVPGNLLHNNNEYYVTESNETILYSILLKTCVYLLSFDLETIEDSEKPLHVAENANGQFFSCPKQWLN